MQFAFPRHGQLPQAHPYRAAGHRVTQGQYQRQSLQLHLTPRLVR